MNPSSTSGAVMPAPRPAARQAAARRTAPRRAAAQQAAPRQAVQQAAPRQAVPRQAAGRQSGPRRPVLRPNSARGQNTRRRLLAAAEAAFGQRGYFATSVADITRRAGVAQGTFYVYFPDKLAIFTELVRLLSRELRHTIQVAVQGLNDRLAVERKGFETFVQFVTRRPNLYRIILQAESVSPPAYRWYYRHFSAGYARRLAEAMDAGQIRRLDPEVLSYCLMGIGNFVGMRYVLWDRARVPRRALASLFDFIARGLAVR